VRNFKSFCSKRIRSWRNWNKNSGKETDQAPHIHSMRLNKNLLLLLHYCYPFSKVKKKIKLSYYCHVGNKGERKYSSCSFLTSELDGGKWSELCPSRNFLPG
jgi:hypothetical protein